MRVTILGCGSSLGVPQLSCNCYVCGSSSPKNKRRRSSILVQADGTTILVDTSPDVKYQLLDNNVSFLDAILLTHDHADHVSGIDEVRALPHNISGIDTYIDDETFLTLNMRFPYIFQNNASTSTNFITRKKMPQRFFIKNVCVQSFPQLHGRIISRGLIFDNIAYSVDFNHIPATTLKKLSGIKVWIIDCLRYSYSTSHSYLEKTLSLIETVRPELAVLTHMGHDIEYHEISKILPKNVIVAYDNMHIYS